MEGRADRSENSTTHEGDIREVAEEQITDQLPGELAAASDVAVLADIPAPSAGYVQAEAAALRVSHNKVLEVLRDAGLIPTA